MISIAWPSACCMTRCRFPNQCGFCLAFLAERRRPNRTSTRSADLMPRWSRRLHSHHVEFRGGRRWLPFTKRPLASVAGRIRQLGPRGQTLRIPSEPHGFISTTILPTARRELMASKASRNLSNGKTIVGGASTAPVSSQAAMSFLRRS